MRDVPSTTWESYNAEAFFGTETGQVCQFTGALDNVDIAGNGGDPIQFSGLLRFTNYNESKFKQVQYMRPAFLSTNVIETDVRAIYDFDVNEGITPVSGVTDLSAQWDISNWDQAVWSGIFAVGRPEGSFGYGRSVAAAVRGSAVDRATLVNVEVAWQLWDFL